MSQPLICDITRVCCCWQIVQQGKCAAEIQSGDELVLCELLFGGAFNTLSLEQLVATASCFVWREKSEKGTPLSEGLVPCLAAVRDAARRVGKVAAECGMPGVSGSPRGLLQ